MNWQAVMADFSPNNLLALYLYWFPLAICLVGYPIRLVYLVKKDLELRREAASVEPGGYYHPTVTVGSILGMVLLSLVPLVNLMAATFDLTPKMLPKVCDWFRELLDIPLVPRRKKSV